MDYPSTQPSIIITPFTALQLTELERNFISNGHNLPPNHVIIHLAGKFNKTFDQINVWFKKRNHEQMKRKLQVRLSSANCDHCQKFFKIIDPRNSKAETNGGVNALMHIPWMDTSPLMDNWPDTSDLYRRMDHNLARFVNDLS